MNRLYSQTFILLLVGILTTLTTPVRAQHSGKVMTVQGPVEPQTLGNTLPHEHILVDFIGAKSVSRDRYNRDSAAVMVTPFLKDLKRSGGQSLVECTPEYLGRDPLLLQRLSESTGLNVITNTGYYGDEQGKFLPDHVSRESAETLARRWIDEWKNGIDNSGVRPGFIKMRVDKAPISQTGRKLLAAAALTHKASGLTIGVHTPDGPTALAQLDLLEKHGIDPSAFIWIHAQNESDSTLHREAARRGAWVEFDGIGPGSADYHFRLIDNMREAGLLHRVLISHDAGWYRVGEPGGAPSKFDPYTYIYEEFIPRLKKAGYTDKEINMLTRENPQQAFTISTRTLDRP